MLDDVVTFPFGDRRRMAFIGVVALAVFGVVLTVRLLLISSDAELAVGQSGVGLENSGQTASQDQVRTVYQGESLWSIARELSKGSDPRPIVDVLVAENGGEVVFVGQEIIIPGEVLD